MRTCLCVPPRREFFQCDFDIAGSYATMVADSEVIKVLGEILSVSACVRQAISLCLLRHRTTMGLPDMSSFWMWLCDSSDALILS